MTQEAQGKLTWEGLTFPRAWRHKWLVSSLTRGHLEIDKSQWTIAGRLRTSLIRLPCVVLLGCVTLGTQPVLACGCTQEWDASQDTPCRAPGLSGCHSFILLLSLSALAHRPLNSTASPSTCKTATWRAFKNIIRKGNKNPLRERGEKIGVLSCWLNDILSSCSDS